MKRYLLYITLAISVLSACKKSNDVAPGDRPEERVSATLNSYSAMLTGNTNGWKAILYPEGGGTFLFAMKFAANNRVNMLSDLSTTASTTSLESSYRLRQEQGPSLLFDTYSYIHLLADPDPTVNGGVAGSGSKSDFEFTFDSVSGDTIKLVGNKLGSKLFLIKAKSATDYSSFTTGSPDVLGKLTLLRTYFKRITIGTTDCEVKVDTKTRQLTFTYVTGTTLTSVAAPFYVDGSTSTMVFPTPVKIGTNTVTDIKAITFDATNRIFGGTINGQAIQLREAITPLLYDVTAVTRFNGSANKQWVSPNGFTRDGVVDYLNIRSIPGFTKLVHWIKYNAAYDLVGFTFGNTINYGPAVAPSVTTGGIIKYTYLGNLGTIPTAQAAQNSAVGNNFGDPQGFYVIQTGSSTFDLVAVKYARTWISYQ